MATISEAFRIALGHHQAGRLDLAEQIYRQILGVEPDHADSLHLLGLIAYQSGQPQAALEPIERAVALNPAADVYLNSLGLTYHALGRVDDAVDCFRRALRLKPNVPGTLNNLGNALRAARQTDEAIDCYRRALKLEPRLVEAHNNLGTALRERGGPDEAVACYRRALALNPNYAEAHNNLGLVLQGQGKLDEAIASFRRALESNPALVEAIDNLGTALRDRGEPEEAMACYHRALELNPGYVIAHSNLGNALKDQRQLDAAIACYHRALELQPDYAIAHYNLGTALRDSGRGDEAAAAFRRAIALEPGMAQAHNALGNALREQGAPDEALVWYRQAVEAAPDYAEAHNNLGTALQDLGRLDEALACYRQALQLKPAYPGAQSNLLLALQYRDGVTLAELAAAHAQYERLHAAPRRAAWRPHDCPRDPERRLRVGFVSPDLGNHPVGHFLIRVLENLDRSQCEVACYSDRLTADDLTDRFRAAAGLWRDTAGLPDSELAGLVRSDAVDILFDLAGHTAANRLMVFALKPAPIQITWAGYVGTTGLSAIDYLLADRYEVPPAAEPHYCERILRMPDGYVCFDPPSDCPAVGRLPAGDRGPITLGCFNSPTKLTPRVIALWARILGRLPGSRLVLKFRGLDGSLGQPLREQFAAQGVDASRLDLLGWSPRRELLEQYNRIDLALDPFPYSGGLTTCEALWMGVPVITCPGETFASRHSLSHLSTVGLTETIARDFEEYAEIAVRLAGDLPRLAEIRAGLRQRVAESPLCDGRRFAANLMEILRRAWRRWCADRSAGAG